MKLHEKFFLDNIIVVFDTFIVIFYSVIPSIFLMQNLHPSGFLCNLETSHNAYSTFSVFQQDHMICIGLTFFVKNRIFCVIGYSLSSFLDIIFFVYNCKGIHFLYLIHSVLIACWCLHRIFLCLKLFEVFDYG